MNQLSNQKISLSAINAELCRRDFFYFVQEFWDTIIHEEPIYNWHIPYLCSELQKIAERVKRREPTEYEYYIINIPPGSSKSTIVSQMYIAWTWTIDPTQRFICASYSRAISRKDAAFTQLILNSDKYKLYFPEIKLDSDAIDLVKNNKGGDRFATSVDSSVTGQHGHQIVIDDPINPQESASEADRKKANDWIQHTLPNRKVKKGMTPTILCMQRLHEDDPTGSIIDRMKKAGIAIKHICLPAELDTNIQPPELIDNYVNGLLDPVRMTQPILNTMKITLGSYGYAGQMQQKPAPAEGGIIKKSWFKIIDSTSVPKVKIDFCADTAYTSDEKNDPCGLLSYAVANNCLYITNFKKGHWEFLNQCKNIQEFAKDNGLTAASIFEVEPKSSGKDIVSTLRTQTSINIKESANPTKDKEARLNDVSPFIESGRVYLVRGGWNDDFIQQVCTFPNAKHDEEVDCIIMACQRAFLKQGMRFM